MPRLPVYAHGARVMHFIIIIIIPSPIPSPGTSPFIWCVATMCIKISIYYCLDGTRMHARGSGSYVSWAMHGPLNNLYEDTIASTSAKPTSLFGDMVLQPANQPADGEMSLIRSRGAIYGCELSSAANIYFAFCRQHQAHTHTLITQCIIC